MVSRGLGCGASNSVQMWAPCEGGVVGVAVGLAPKGRCLPPPGRTLFLHHHQAPRWSGVWAATIFGAAWRRDRFLDIRCSPPPFWRTPSPHPPKKSFILKAYPGYGWDRAAPCLKRCGVCVPGLAMQRRVSCGSVLARGWGVRERPASAQADKGRGAPQPRRTSVVDLGS